MIEKLDYLVSVPFLALPVLSSGEDLFCLGIDECHVISPTGKEMIYPLYTLHV